MLLCSSLWMLSIRKCVTSNNRTNESAIETLYKGYMKNGKKKKIKGLKHNGTKIALLIYSNTSVNALGRGFVFSPLCLKLPSELSGFPSSSPQSSIPPSRSPNTACLCYGSKKVSLSLTGKPAHTPHSHIPAVKRGWCVCACLCWDVAICVNSLLVCVSVCVYQDKDIEGEEEEEEAVTGVSKVNSTTSQLFGVNTDTNTLSASRLAQRIKCLTSDTDSVKIRTRLTHSYLLRHSQDTHAHAHNIAFMTSHIVPKSVCLTSKCPYPWAQCDKCTRTPPHTCTQTHTHRQLLLVRWPQCFFTVQLRYSRRVRGQLSLQCLSVNTPAFSSHPLL